MATTDAANEKAKIQGGSGPPASMTKKSVANVIGNMDSAATLKSVSLS
jgi:hypothetical protein